MKVMYAVGSLALGVVLGTVALVTAGYTGWMWLVVGYVTSGFVLAVGRCV